MIRIIPENDSQTSVHLWSNFGPTSVQTSVQTSVHFKGVCRFLSHSGYFKFLLPIQPRKVLQIAYFSGISLSFDQKTTEISEKHQKMVIWRPKSAQIGLKFFFDPSKKSIFWGPKNFWTPKNRFFRWIEILFSDRFGHFLASKPSFFGVFRHFSLFFSEQYCYTTEIR